MPSSTQEKIRKALILGTRYSLRRLPSRKPKGRFFILAYHRVLETAECSYLPEPGTWVDVRTFEKQISFLRKTCEIVPLPKLVESLRDGSKPSTPVCAITFDDGWRDNFTNAFPILRSFNIPATIFLTTGCLDDGRAPWFADAWDASIRLREEIPTHHHWPHPIKGHIAQLSHTCDPNKRGVIAMRCMNIIKTLAPELRQEVLDHLINVTGWSASERSMLSWDEARLMRDGGIDFGAHTRGHSILTQLPTHEMRDEIYGSKMDIETALGHKTTSFAYPNGDLNNDVRQVVVEAGFDLACTTKQSHCQAFDDPLTLPRLCIHEGISEGLISFSPLTFGLRLGIV